MNMRRALGYGLFALGLLIQAYLYPWTPKDVAWFGLFVSVIGLMLILGDTWKSGSDK